ncbi:MAG: FtsW/RodA/SpoVE family cell cycle protein [Oscillospiraceae bacterium]|nr:FtsW/RodA/SpoVE family cell cycle protein [Oscillospiraceae bacterium]
MIPEYACAAARYLTPVLAVWILYRCVRSGLREKYEPEVWGYLTLANGEKAPLRHWECIMGRSRSSDIIIDHKTVSRTHAALIRDGDGEWTVCNLGAKHGVKKNGEEVEKEAVTGDGDILSLADVEIEIRLLSEEERLALSENRTKPGKFIHPGRTFFILTVLQMQLAVQHMFAADEGRAPAVVLSFFAAAAVMWCYYLIMRSARRTGFEVETAAFFLSTLGISVAAVSTPDDMLKQMLLFAAGILFFVILGRWLRSLKRAKSASLPVAVIAVVLLAANLIFAERIMGARNWLMIAGFSLQPSEFVKIAFVYTGAATLDRLFLNKNLFVFIVFSALCVGALVLMGDFGTAAVFFCTFLVIAYMRSGNLATVFLSVTAAVLAGFLVLSIKPYIAARFDLWGHVWEFPYDAGYQQTRALSAVASGGLFGLGAGNGVFHSIVAADTDLVFALLCEESGLITALCAVFALPVLAAFTVKNAAQGRSSFYVIAACAAVSMMMIQMSLNVFGSLDILPFTGITFPFVSRGGSSLISCWAMAAFIKAADTRQNAGFSVKFGRFRQAGEKGGDPG